MKKNAGKQDEPPPYMVLKTNNLKTVILQKSFIEYLHRKKTFGSLSICHSTTTTPPPRIRFHLQISTQPIRSVDISYVSLSPLFALEKEIQTVSLKDLFVIYKIRLINLQVVTFKFMV